MTARTLPNILLIIPHDLGTMLGCYGDTSIQTPALDGLAAEVEIVKNQFHEAKEKYASAKESVSLAEEALRLANLMYEEGASTQLDVLNSQLALTRAKMNSVSSHYEYQMSRYQLRKVTGTLHGILD